MRSSAARPLAPGEEERFEERDVSSLYDLFSLLCGVGYGPTRARTTHASRAETKTEQRSPTRSRKGDRR